MFAACVGRVARRVMPRPVAVVRLSVRNTVIVRRVNKPPLVTIPSCDPLATPQHLVDKSVIHTEDDKYMIYEIEELSQQDHKVKVILLRNVDDYGVKGQIVTVPYTEAHKYILLPGFGVYHSPANASRYADIIIPEETRLASSESARQFVNYWAKRVLDVGMSRYEEWSLEKWHIKAAFRLHGTWLEEKNIQIPGGLITGPDLTLENRDFIVLVTLNNFDKVQVRCRIHHKSEDPDHAVAPPFWYFPLTEPIWEHERQALLDMNRSPPHEKILKEKSWAAEVKKYREWKIAREHRMASSS